MDTFVHVVIFLASVGVIWFFAGILVDAVSRISRRYCKSGFLTAFFILGFLTSISEFSVAANSAIGGVPGVSVGNLIGASFVILLFIVPLLAIAGNGIRLNGAISKGMLALILVTIVLPVLLVLDGDVTKTEGLLALLVYGTLAYALYRKREPIKACDTFEENIVERVRLTIADGVRILVGGVVVFAAAHFLVEQAVYFADTLQIPNSLVGLVMLSIGTNIPEIVIAVRSIFRGRSDIAFGDYLGSAAMNSLIFGGLALATGTFVIEPSEFIVTAVLLVTGLGLLYVFASSRLTLSRKEAILLILFYVAFLGLQIWNAVRFASA